MKAPMPMMPYAAGAVAKQSKWSIYFGCLCIGIFLMILATTDSFPLTLMWLAGLLIGYVVFVTFNL